MCHTRCDVECLRINVNNNAEGYVNISALSTFAVFYHQRIHNYFIGLGAEALGSVRDHTNSHFVSAFFMSMFDIFISKL